MSDRFRVHPTHPQARLVSRAAEAIAAGQLGLLPTDAGYALVWGMEARDAEERVLRLRRLDSKHLFTLLCASISQAGALARIDDRAFRFLRSRTPGPCTVILPAAAALPRRLKQAKRRAVGVRLPDHPVAQALIAEVREPLLSTTLALPGDDDLSNHEADEVAERMMRHVGFMLDAGDTEPGPTSVIDLTDDEPQLVRQGYRPVEL